jgi:3-oxoacyl-[acyl-carrier-protein] synthase II
MSGNPQRNVVITRMGAVSPAGRGVESLWEALRAGRDLVSGITVFDPSPYDCRTAALVPDRGQADPRDFVDAAVDEALRGLWDESGPTATGVSMGTTLGRMQLLHKVRNPGESRDALRRIPYHAITDETTRRVGASIPPATVSGACASSLIAVGLGMMWIRQGRADRVLSGGYDAFNEFVHAGFASLMALTPGRIQPFDRDRSGIVLGEGAGILLLEEEAFARSHGREPLARLSGFACLSDANHITGPHPDGDGLYRTIAAAAAMAGAGPEEFDYVCAHGTGTVFNDRMEALALRRFFGPDGPPASSPKSMMGHTLGASGALETIVSVLALRQGLVPPTIHFKIPDPECPIDPVPGKAREMQVRRVLKTSAGFGGQNCALVLERVGDE